MNNQPTSSVCGISIVGAFFDIYYYYYCYYYYYYYYYLTAIALSPGGSSPTLVQTKIKIRKTTNLAEFCQSAFKNSGRNEEKQGRLKRMFRVYFGRRDILLTKDVTG
jgi:hypothetical protein